MIKINFNKTDVYDYSEDHSVEIQLKKQSSSISNC